MTTSPARLTTVVSALAAALAVGGCVRTAPLDPNIVTRYQQARLADAPQPRAGKAPLDLLVPDEPGEIPLTRLLRSGPTEYDLADSSGPKPSLRRMNERVRSALDELENSLPAGQRTRSAEGDSLTVVGDDWSVRAVRPWQTRAVLRVTAEADSAETLESLAEQIRSALGEPPAGAAEPVPVVRLSAAEAIRLALANSVDIAVVAYDPAIARQELEEAQAAFDYTVFGSFSNAHSDENSGSALFGSQSRTIPFELGVRNRNTWGGEAALSWSLTRMTDNSAFTQPEPRYESITSLELTQPLLRFAGPAYNLAGVHLAQVGEQVAYSQFRQRVEETLSGVFELYWSLVRARENVRIQRRLLDRTMETLDQVKGRGGLDATKVVISQTAAAVASRRAALVTARKAVLDVQDQLARLLADRRLTPVELVLIEPTTEPTTDEVVADPAEQLVAALRNSPLLEQARLAIEAAEINVRVARNETLPVLNFVASLDIQGLQQEGEEAVEEMLTTEYFSHSWGFNFEYPLGNRAALAALRRRKLERLQSVSELQNAADQVAVSVQEAFRQIVTSKRELQSQLEAVQASREQLQALDALEKKLAQLTPEFMQVKLQAQESLARAQNASIQAAADYRTALARLARVTGTILQQNGIKLAVEEVMAPSAD
jgi:outer membrane protein TolC